MENVYSYLEPMVSAAGGISLSQISAVTGLEGSTIQNWVKRGWVAPSKGKKYGERSVVRILLINILRGALKLEDIAKLMAYVNGDVVDEGDDILSDTPLYDLLCRLISEVWESRLFREDEIKTAVETRIPPEIKGESRRILKETLVIMVQSALAGYFREQAENGFDLIES